MKFAAITPDEAPTAQDCSALSSVRVPHLAAAAFCLTEATREAIERAGSDRRLTRLRTSITMAGIEGACRAYAAQRMPALLIVEVESTDGELLTELDALAAVCDAETRVVLIGARNDIALYRTLMERGVADYLLSPLSPLAFVASVQRLFAAEAATVTRLGKMFAFIGAKGGVGTSTLARNVAWTIAAEQASPTLMVDLDYRFGTTGVDLDVKPVPSLEKYIVGPERLDGALLDRFAVPRGDFFSVLPGFENPLAEVDPSAEAIEHLLGIARATFPNVVADLPHDWSASSRDVLIGADEVVVVAVPDLQNLRNTRALMDRLRAFRPNDPPPRVVLNQCRMPRRKEIDVATFTKSIGVASCASIAFDPATFGAAAADGRTIREQAPRSKSQQAIRNLSCDLTGQKPAIGPLRRLFGLGAGAPGPAPIPRKRARS